MENPYWQDQFKPHLVDRDEIRRLCFQIDSIVTASTTRQGSGIVSDDENDKDDRVNPILDDLFYRMAESELSKRLLHLALLVRTFDDTMSRADDGTLRKASQSHRQPTRAIRARVRGTATYHGNDPRMQ